MAPGSLATVCEIGSGGVATIELVSRTEDGVPRLYAVKRLRRELLDEAAFRAMFLDEARVAGLVRHPHVVPVLEVGEDERGPYLVMEYVEGVSLARLMARSIATREVLPLPFCIEVARQLALGLHAAHELRDAEGRPMELVHRDVSPNNVLLAYEGAARLTDFGIARALGRLTRTRSGVIKGTRGYQAPEQLLRGRVDRRADLFALGVLFYELLAGARLYDRRGEDDGAGRILREPPPDLGDDRPDAPAELVELLFELLAKDPTWRPASASIVADRVDAIARALDDEDEPFAIETFLLQRYRDERDRWREHVAALLRRSGGRRWSILSWVRGSA